MKNWASGCLFHRHVYFEFEHGKVIFGSIRAHLSKVGRKLKMVHRSMKPLKIWASDVYVVSFMNMGTFDLQYVKVILGSPFL